MNDQSSTNRQSSTTWVQGLLWIGSVVLLPLLYFLACPWFALFGVALFPSLMGDSLQAKALERLGLVRN
jgi:hypothetical protein